ncbi:MAG: DUF3343 domain-containing protein [Phascolarctobacterium sp.]|nr:DUF3343 domain-containing protein [Phascolarctobacterium sp.]
MARVKKAYKIITFATTTAAMAMENFCLENNLPGRLIPVPQEISSGCGVAWRVLVEDYDSIEPMRSQMNFIWEQVIDLMM